MLLGIAVTPADPGAGSLLCSDSGPARVRSVPVFQGFVPPPHVDHLPPRLPATASLPCPGARPPEASPHRGPRDMSVSDRTKLILAFRSGDRCALPTCGRSLTQRTDSGEWIRVGEAAHIAGERPGAARHDPDLTSEARNAYDNLIYLCANCHSIIDQAPGDYPVTRLVEIKSDHERTVQVAMEARLGTIRFPQLEAALADAARWFRDSPSGASPSDFHLLAPEEKLHRNGLGDHSRNLLSMGLAAAGQVTAFLTARSRTDPEFVPLLTQGFLAEYRRLRRDGSSGDALFEMMCAFATGGNPDPTRNLVGTAVVAHLFESCEIFEK